MDVYMTMNLPSGKLISVQIVDTDYIQAQHAESLLHEARTKAGSWPESMIIRKGDPAEVLLAQTCAQHQLELKCLPESYLEDLLTPVKQSYSQQVFSPSSVAYSPSTDPDDEIELENARHMIPDAYDPCWCASGKKFKFCCKPIFREIIGAMASAEEGDLAKALEYISAAKQTQGETAEVLCRESIVMSIFGRKEAETLLDRALAVNPDHPRANYIRGLNLKESGNYKAAVDAYERAIKNYPVTDRYHLNESYNNLGTAFYCLGEFQKAKDAWEKGLIMLPHDQTVRKNLIGCIYGNPEVPAKLRVISPFVRKYFDQGR